MSNEQLLAHIKTLIEPNTATEDMSDGEVLDLIYDLIAKEPIECPMEIIEHYAQHNDLLVSDNLIWFATAIWNESTKLNTCINLQTKEI